MGDGFRWDERKASWDDFQLAEEVFGDFDANIASEIRYPEGFSSDENLVYAAMFPKYSNRTADAHESEQLLIHEQYHFNITEYHARLLRKKLLEKGASLSKKNIKYHYNRINEQQNEMQAEYDEVSVHNTETEGQRFWELKIDDLLRQTAYYKNPDLESYYEFRKPDTRFYRKIYSTVRQKILPSYPVFPKDSLNGVTYELIKTEDRIIIKHRNNGALQVGGDLHAAITVIDYSPSKTTIRFLDQDSVPLDTTLYAKLVIETPDDSTKIATYYDKEDQRTHATSPNNPQPNVYKKKWKFSKDGLQANVTFFGLDDQPAFVDNHIYGNVRFIDPLGRSTGIEQHDASGNLQMDQDLAAVYDYSFDHHNNITRVRLYDENRKYADHLNSANLFYEYDKRGNISKRQSLDNEGNPAMDANGVSFYEYQYDLRDNLTSVKRFNENNRPVLDGADVFHVVTDYDEKDRLVFNASYYPDYVLKFTENFNGATRIAYATDSLMTTYNVDGYNYTYAANDSIAIIKEYLNDKRHIVNRSYFSNEEKPAQVDDHAVTFIMTYDDRGNMLLEKGLDALGCVFTKSSNVASIAYEYDANNNKTKVRYFDAEDAPVNADTGENYIVYIYNADNLLVEKRNYDTEHNPVVIDDAYRTTFEYNRFKKDSIIKQYGVSNRLNPGASTTRLFYNNYGNLSRETYHDPSGNRAANYERISRIDYLFNKKQAIISYRYYNKQDRLQNNSEGYARIDKKRNKNNFVQEESYYNRNNMATQGPQGYHKIVYDWNDTGVTIRSTTYDKNMKLWENENGIAIYKFEYFSSAMDSVVEFYDRHQVLTEDLDGIAKISYLKTMNALYYNDLEYDAAGKILNGLEPIERTEFTLSEADTIPKTQFSEQLEQLEELLKEERIDENNESY